MEGTPVTATPVMDTTITNNDLAIVVAVPLATNGENVSINGEKKRIKKKRSGGFSLFKAARLFFRPKPSYKPKPPASQLEVASNGAAENWKKIVGSIRPLHLQDHPSPSPPPLTVKTAVDDENQPAVEQFEDVIPAPVSPRLSTSSTSDDSPSVYGSAMNLQELDNHGENDDDDEEEEEEDEDKVFDDKPADELIDAKAEEFIAHFYAQMRLQQLDSAYRRRNE